jgi:TatD DNase family protein
MTAKLIDTHFHLDYYRNHKELYANINRLKQFTLCVTSSPGVFNSCKNLYNETDYVKFALGFHPKAKELTEKDFSVFLRLVDRAAAVGEVGMDFSSANYLPKDKQIDYFEHIVCVCSNKNKLISIHLKKSENEAIKIISKYQPSKCVIHWYSGTIGQLNTLINLNCYFSINSNMVASKNSKSKLALIPKDKILIESDGPFTKVDGKKYYPEMLHHSYQFVSEQLGIPDLIPMVYTNYKSLI